MTSWQVGRATITPVIEVETITSPRFLFRDLDKAGVKEVAAPAFPSARYVFATPEVEYWRDTAYPDDDNIFADSVAPVLDAGLADLVPMAHEVCPGVRFDPTPGHTPGHVSLVVESGGDRAV